MPALSFIAPDLRALAVPVNELSESPGNARLHRDRDVLAIVESLRRFGQRKAVVGKRQYRGVENAIICGNGTLRAARRLRWSHLAVAWFEGSDDEARAYAVVDNRSAELSTWDLNVLARDVAEVDLSAWFTPVELADLLSSNAPVPEFPAVDETAQGQLDALSVRTVKCPSCGHTFTEGG